MRWNGLRNWPIRPREAQGGASQAFEAFLDLFVGQAVVGQRVRVLGRTGTLLALGVGLLRGRAGGVGEVDAEVAVDLLDLAMKSK